MSTPLTKHARQVGVFAVLLYGLCLLWKVTITDPSVADLHMQLLKLALPGFQGLTVGSVVWGGVLAFIYGALAATIFHKIHRNCCTPK